MKEDFFSQYMEYVGASESPIIYHRWALLSIVGALLGRQAWLPFGHFTIYPNQYILLMGTAGARKSSAIDIAKNLLKASGYNRFAPARTSKECLLREMASSSLSDDLSSEELLNLTMDEASELFVCKGEFVDFLGISDLGMMNLLTDIWDNPLDYDNPKITKRNVKVEKPTLSILGGATPQGIAMAIPTEALETGFTSRLLFIYADPSGTKITFPSKPCPSLKSSLVERLKRIKRDIKGELSFTPDAMKILDDMYHSFHSIDDTRFSKYSARRLTHLIKLSLILAAMEEKMEVSEKDCVYANTILGAAEVKMPKALGEFGKSKYSAVANTIVEHLSHKVRPVTTNELWKVVAKDLTKIAELGEIMKNLIHSDKVQIVTIKDKQGYMSKHQEARKWKEGLIDESFLREEERIIL